MKVENKSFENITNDYFPGKIKDKTNECYFMIYNIGNDNASLSERSEETPELLPVVFVSDIDIS